jgi:hypothetical protein
MANDDSLLPYWQYKTLEEGDTVRDPIQGEFFSTEAIENSADALVREGIQNSLDARCFGEQLRIRIRISGREAAIESSSIEWLMRGSWDHLLVSGNGLREPPQVSDPCCFVAFEDFGTSGLEGDPHQWRKVPGQKNNFFNFFRAEGHSDKSETDRGRWGVGKTVFPRSSRISSFWGVTRRASDGAGLLLGRTILKSHDLADGKTYVPDGYFGNRSPNSRTVFPVVDDHLIQKFCQTFGLQRGTNPGLSIVIPFYDEAEITTATVQHSVIVGYFVPILKKELIVEIVDPSGTVTFLDHSNLENIAGATDHTRSLMSVIQLSTWSRGLQESELTCLNKPPANRAPRWTPELFPDGSIEALRKSLKAGERVAIRVPMPVREKRKEAAWSYFDVFLANDGSDKRGRPIYVRDGITISDVRGRTTHGVASLVLVTDKPLSTLLGDSENPAHTQWQTNCSHYRDKYETGVANITFVADSVAEILRLITESDVEEDPSVLIDLFSLPKPRDEESMKTRRKKPKDTEPEVSHDESPNPPPPKPKGFRVTKSKGGFSITNSDGEAPQPNRLLVEVAYDDRSSNPLNGWYRTDFDFEKLKVSPPKELEGSVKVLSANGNELLLKVVQPQFRLNVSGFDERRNLFVRVVEKEDDNGN